MWTGAMSMGGKLNSIFVRSKWEMNGDIQLFKTEQSNLVHSPSIQLGPSSSCSPMQGDQIARSFLTRPPTGTPRRAINPGEGRLLLAAPLQESGQGCPLLRASDEHSFTVRVLRARRAPGRSRSPLPLDAATDTSSLIAVDRLPGEDGIDRGA